MKLYHYVAKPNDVLEKGILSFVNNPDADISYYTKRSKTTTKAGVVQWLEKHFEGRSRAIRGFSEPIKWHDKSLSLKQFVENADLFEINLDALEKDGFIESVWHSPSVLTRSDLTEENCQDELLEKLNSIRKINYTPIDWSVCDDETGRRFAFVSYYLIVVKGGVILPKYLTRK